MKRFAKILGRLLGACVVLLGLGVAYVWMTVPLNTSWKGMLQQMNLLPAWLESRGTARRSGQQSAGGS